MAAIELIVGLGNPGPQYDQTRHNAGFWFVDEIARSHGQTFKLESKYHAELCQLNLAGKKLWLLKPNTYMNKSGKAVAALANFYKIPAENILVAHDELDLPNGRARLKVGGGHGGHNGLRDIIACLGKKEFQRLRIGIDHPGSSSEVSNYVLNKPRQDEKQAIEIAIDEALRILPELLADEQQKAMNHLHSRC